MPLRKSTCLTPQQLDANRSNSQRSTGPRSQAGKERMKMNALKHGCDAAPENEAAVMRALGEDPERYAALKRDLATAYGPGDPLWEQQIEDLAKRYWRRDRIERMQTGLMRRALEALEERRRERRREIAAATFDPSHTAAMDIDLGEPTDSCVRLRLLLSLLGVLRAQVRQRVFKLRQQHQIASYYQGEIGWRPARLRHLLGLFIERAQAEQQGEPSLHGFVSEHFEGGEAAVEACYQELLTLLDEEIADLEEEFKHEGEAQEERDAADRDACLAPEGRTREMLVRQEMALDRSIDRKVKMILTMRKEHARRREEASPPEDEPNDWEAWELSKLAGLDGAPEVAPNFSSAHAHLKVSAASRPDSTTESPRAEEVEETTKSPEQSQNVIENQNCPVKSQIDSVA